MNAKLKNIETTVSNAASDWFQSARTLLWGSNFRRTVFLISAATLVIGFFIVYRGTRPEVIAITLISAVGVYLIIRQPAFGILLLTLVQILFLGEQITLPFVNITLSLHKFYGIFIFVSFIINAAILKKNIRIGDKYQIAFLSGLFLIIVVSSFRAFTFSMVMTKAIKFSLLVIFYVLSYNLISDKRWIRLFILVTLGCTVVNFFIVLYQVVGLGIPRPSGGTTGAILMSYYSNFGMIAFIILFGYYKDLKYRIINGIGAVLTGFGVLLSNSRGPVLAALIVLVALFIRERKNYRVYFAVLVIVAIVYFFWWKK